MSDNELLHWGIKGMKWGRRRYQNKDGSLTPAGKKRYAKLSDELDSLKGPDKKAEEDYATSKAKAIKSGSAAEVLKYKGDLTQQEMQSIENRLRWEHSMADTAKRDAIAAQGKSTIDKMAEKADKITKQSESFIKLYNTGANLINAFGDLDVQLPKVDTNVQNGNRSQRKAEKKKAKEEVKKQAEQEKQEKKESKQAEKEDKGTKPNDSAKQENTKTETKTDNKPTETIDLKDYIGPSLNLPVSQAKNSPVAQAGKSWIEEMLEEQSRSGGH